MIREGPIMSKRDNLYIIQKPEKYNWTNILVGICFAVACLALGLALAINLRPLYTLSIGRYDIEAESGLSPVVIKENYNALIDYCSPFFTDELSFPSLRSSESGLSHFAECKNIFNGIYLAGVIALVITVIAFIIKRHCGEYKHFRACAIITAALPIVIGTFALINFDALFLIFHKLTFSNNDWLFDPETDPIINLLPEAYFMDCALVIVGVMLIGAAVSLVIYFVMKKKNKTVNLLPHKKNYYY